MCILVTGLPDFYVVLNLGPQATAGEIGHAYRSLVRRHRPDTRPRSLTPATQDEAAAERELLQRIMDAHAILADPAQRALYDRRNQHTDTATTPGPSRGAPPRRPAPLYNQPLMTAGPLRWEPPARRRI